MAALLGIVANALFLDAYGSNWLPVTYIAIGVAGIVLSGAVSRSARTVGYLHIALVVLGGSAAAIGAALGHRRRRGRRMGLGAPAGAVPDPHPARVRVHRRAGRPAARHRRDQGLFPADHGGVPRRSRGRRLARRVAGDLARPDGVAAPRDRDRPGRVRRARVGDRPPLRVAAPRTRLRPGAGLHAGRGGRLLVPVVDAAPVRDALPGIAARLPGPVRTRQPAVRLPGLRPRERAVPGSGGHWRASLRATRR